VLDGLVRQRNALIAEIQSLKDDQELTVNALNVTHQLTVQSMSDQFETRLASQLAAGQLCFIVTTWVVLQGACMHATCKFIQHQNRETNLRHGYAVTGWQKQTRRDENLVGV